jgi:hypothetical protein
MSVTTRSTVALRTSKHEALNNALERTVNHVGRTVRAVALCARAGAHRQLRPAAQRDR